MHKDRNRSAIRRISKGLIRANRIRNFFAVFAIFLTTFMIATVFSFGISYADHYRTMTIRNDGTTASISLPHGTTEQKRALQGVGGIKSIGTEIPIGRYTARESNLSDVSVLYRDRTNFEEQYTPAISDIEGSYPDAADEIMASEAALATLGITDPEQGMEIPVSFDTSDGQISGIFHLSGWFRAYEPGNSAVILVSESFCEERGYSMSDGMLTIDAERDTAGSDLEQYVSLSAGQEFQDRYLSGDNNTSDRIKIIALICMLALFIVFSGYLLIYNIFYISITKDIRIYGLLKTIGTSPRQLKKIVLRQGMLLGISGIIPGIVLSFLTSSVIVPHILSAFMQMPAQEADQVSVSPLIIVFTVAFSVFTIWISCRKPARIAARTAPAEAVKYIGTGGRRRKTRHSTSGGKLWKMALRNIFRDKKRVVIVFLSLFMGSVTLLSISSFFGSLNSDNYAKYYLPHDFSYSYNAYAASDGQEGFPQEFLEEALSQDGITDSETISSVWLQIAFDEDVLMPVLTSGYPEAAEDPAARQSIIQTMRDLAENGEYGCSVYEVDDSFAEEYNREHEEKIDEDAFREGRAVLILKYQAPAEELVGKNITLTSQDTGLSCSAGIAGVLSFSEFGYSSSMLGGAPEGFVVSRAFLEQIRTEAPVVAVDIDVEPQKEAEIRKNLEVLNADYLEENTYEFTAKTDALADFESTMKMLELSGDGISLLLLFIGVLNFVNVVITGMITRKNEFAVLESIGMTKGQIRRMVTLEGFFYALISALLILTAGNGILSVVAALIPSIADYAEFTYPAAVLVLLFVLIFAVCLIVPQLVYRIISRQTVTERLKDFSS